MDAWHTIGRFLDLLMDELPSQCPLCGAAQPLLHKQMVWEKASQPRAVCIVCRACGGTPHTVAAPTVDDLATYLRERHHD